MNVVFTNVILLPFIFICELQFFFFFEFNCFLLLLKKKKHYKMRQISMLKIFKLKLATAMNVIVYKFLQMKMPLERILMCVQLNHGDCKRMLG